MDELFWFKLGRAFFTRAEALDEGWDDRALALAVRQGVILRVKRGYYVDAQLWRGLDELGRYRIRCLMALHGFGPAVALSHVSAVVMHDLPTWGVPLTNVHVTRLDGGASRAEAGIVHHLTKTQQEEIVDVEGGLATSPHRAVIETSTLGTAEAALVHMDALLHLVDGDHDKLMSQLDAMNDWPGTRRLLIPARLATGGSHSVGESRGRWLFWRAGLPIPDCQVEIRDADDRLIATTDWGWEEHRALGEFDGQVKYGRLLKSGQAPGDVVFAEKKREDLVRRTTKSEFIRLVWSDYERPRLTARWVAEALGVRPRW